MTYRIISTTQELEDFCGSLFDSEPAIAVDTEFVRQKTFWPQLCLIQVASSKEIVLIDALAEGIELSAFHKVLKDPKITKVLHAAHQDLEIFYKLFDEVPQSLFDTQIAAMFCGFGESLGYDALIRRQLDIALDKSSQFTNWAQRPLTDKQLSYAARDVEYLLEIHQQLTDKLAELDRTAWFEEEMTGLYHDEAFRQNPAKAWERIKVHPRKPRVISILQDLAAWRDTMAAELNLNRGSIIRDDVLAKLAAQSPNAAELSVKYVDVLRTLDKASVKDDFLDVYGRACNKPKIDWPEVEPALKPMPPSQQRQYDFLKLFIVGLGEELGLPARVLISKSDLETFVRGGCEDFSCFTTWRQEVVGNAVREAIAGKRVLGLKFDRYFLSDI